MRGRLAGGAEVVDRLDDAAPKQMMPDTVHHHARNERVGRVDHPPGQGHPATPTGGRLALGQGLQKRSRHQLCLRCLVIAAHQNRFILAAAIEQRQRPRGARDGLFKFRSLLLVRRKTGRRLAKVGRAFQQIVMANHPIEQLRRFATGLSVRLIACSGDKHASQALGQAGVALQQLGQARVHRADHRRFAPAKLHPLEREVAARRELHMHPEADVVAHAMPVPLPLVTLAVEFLADDTV